MSFCSVFTPPRPEPLKMAYITDFTIVCPDRDILVVKECLKLSSKLFKSTLEDDSDCNSLPFKWDSPGIARVMEYTHTFPARLAVMELKMTSDVLKVETSIVEFCFQYEIEPLLTTLKDQMMRKIPKEPISHGWSIFFTSSKIKIQNHSNGR